MSRQAGFAADRIASRKGNLPSTDKWAVSRDWTIAFHGGPVDGRTRRAPAGDYSSAFEPEVFQISRQTGAMVRHRYRVTGVAPYQRVVFAFYAGGEHAPYPRVRKFSTVDQLAKLMEEDGDL